MHLSCSDPFTGGWGQSAGPVEGVDTNWQIAFFSIARYNSQGFFKTCGNVVNPFDVPNTATATGEDSFGTETVSDDATVTVRAGHQARPAADQRQASHRAADQLHGRRQGDRRRLGRVAEQQRRPDQGLAHAMTGPARLSGAEPLHPRTALLDASDPGWNGGTLLTGEAILRFDFKNKSANSGYTIRVNFADGTFLDISQ